MFQRNALLWLRQWRVKSNRKPLVIRGARQVGKTSLVKAFSEEFDLFLSFNLDVAEDLALFSKELPIKELYNILLATRSKVKIDGSVLIFIDEIQNSPIAIKMLRYFYEELPDIYVIAAGSLLESMLQINKQVSFPVGRVEYMALRPCSFDEFLGAIGENAIQSMLREVNVPEVLHNKVLSLFNKYALVGGMPQVVDEYAKNEDLVALDDVYQSLIAGYYDDVEKYSRLEANRNVIRHIITNGWTYAAQRIVFERFAESNYKSREMGDAFRMLEKTMLLELCYPSTHTALPITPDHKKKPKLLWLDTGLVNYAAGVQSEIFGKENLNDAWRGHIAEHIIGQELISQSNKFLESRTFWVRESKNSQAELDYLYNSRYYGLVPIEVKSGSNAHLRSLQTFMLESPCSFAIRFWHQSLRIDDCFVEEKDKEGTVVRVKSYKLYSLPYYYAGYLEIFLSKYLNK